LHLLPVSSVLLSTVVDSSRFGCSYAVTWLVYLFVTHTTTFLHVRLRFKRFAVAVAVPFFPHTPRGTHIRTRFFFGFAAFTVTCARLTLYTPFAQFTTHTTFSPLHLHLVDLHWFCALLLGSLRLPRLRFSRTHWQHWFSLLVPATGSFQFGYPHSLTVYWTAGFHWFYSSGSFCAVFSVPYVSPFGLSVGCIPHVLVIQFTLDSAVPVYSVPFGLFLRLLPVPDSVVVPVIPFQFTLGLRLGLRCTLHARLRFTLPRSPHVHLRSHGYGSL